MSAFTEGVKACGLENHYKAGKQALNNVAKSKVDEDGAQLHGSLDLDSALAAVHPNACRWDYVVAHSTSSGASCHLSWIEVHPANPGEVKSIINKRDWLVSWLQGSGSPLNLSPRGLVWIASGGVGVTAQSPQRKQLAQAGVTGPCKMYRLKRLQSS